MPTGITSVSSLSNSVVTRYEKEYFLQLAAKPSMWGQFVDWQPPMGLDSGNGGSSLSFPVFGETDLVEDTLNEVADVTPETISDDAITVTPAEWGKTWAISKKSRYMGRVNFPELFGKLVADNRTRSVDRVLRRSVCGRGSTKPTMTIHIDGTAALASLVTTTDIVTYAFLMDLAQQAYSMDIEPYDGLGFVAPIHPLLAYDIKNLTQWTSVGYYQDKSWITGAIEKPFTLAGITFVPTLLGHVHLGAGTAVQGATTLSAAAAKGATTVVVASASGLSVGDYITIGTVETYSVNPGSNLEQVEITGVNSTTLTIRGNGVGENFGLRFDHTIAESVVEAPNVASIPLIGKGSLIGVHGSDCGREGLPVLTEDLDLLKRFRYWGWYWFGGLGIRQKKIIVGKCTTTKFMRGYN